MMPTPRAPHTTQYFEIFGNRGIYQDGWTAVTHHSTPWLTREWPSFDEDDWELYDTNVDWSQANDLSKEMPQKLREMQYLFMIEAAKYGVFPLDDRRYERFNAATAGRPDLPGWPHDHDLLSRHGHADGEHGAERQEPLPHRHRRGGSRCG